jgi:hypothetical protein
MAEVEIAKALLVDQFGRIRELVTGLTEGLSEEAATFRVDPGANTIAWLIWHQARVQDDHLADAAGTEQVWPQWRDRFGLPFGPDATGYGQDSDEVAAVRVPGKLLDGYHADVHEATLRYLDRLDADELERVIDTNWDPPVTVAVRLVSVIGDCLQHLGQAALIRGVADRAGT